MSQPEIIRWDQAYNRNGDGKLPRAVVNVIRTYMDNDTLAGWVSQETLARDAGLDESNVRRQIRKNADAGWLVVTKRGRAGRASEYRLTYPQPGADARLDTEDAETPTAQIRAVEHADPNRAQMPGYTPQPGEYARLLPGEYARPTTPRTSPQEKFSRGPVEATTETGSDSGSWGSAPEPATGAPEGLVCLQSQTADSGLLDDPFASEPAWRVEAARKQRAAESREPASAGAVTGWTPDPPEWD